MRCNKCTNERGSSLLITLALMLLLTGVAMVAVNESTTDVQLSFNQMHEEQAFYLAEAGATRAWGFKDDDPSWNEGFANVSQSDGSYTVTIEDSTTNASLADTAVVTSWGQYDGARVGIEMMLVPVIFRPFQYALFSDSAMEFKNGGLTDSYNSDSGSYATTSIFDYGDVGSNGTITTKNGTLIGGSVSTSLPGALDLNGASTIAGDTTSEAPVVELPEIPQSEFDYVALNNDNASGMSGSFTYNPSTFELSVADNLILQSGTYYFTDIVLLNSGYIELAPGAEVTIFLDGDLEAKNSSAINDGGQPSSLQIFSSGDLVLKNSGDIYAAFYSPTGDADLRNSGDFYGSIMSSTSVVHNSAGFHYDRDLLNSSRDWIVGMRQVAWRELVN